MDTQPRSSATMKVQYARSRCFLEPNVETSRHILNDKPDVPHRPSENDLLRTTWRTLRRGGTYSHLCPEPWLHAHLGYTTTCTSLHEELWAILHHAMCKGGIQHRIPEYRASDSYTSRHQNNVSTIHVNLRIFLFFLVVFSVFLSVPQSCHSFCQFFQFFSFSSFSIF